MYLEIQNKVKEELLKRNAELFLHFFDRSKKIYFKNKNFNVKDLYTSLHITLSRLKREKRLEKKYKSYYYGPDFEAIMKTFNNKISYTENKIKQLKKLKEFEENNTDMTLYIISK